MQSKGINSDSVEISLSLYNIYEEKLLHRKTYDAMNFVLINYFQIRSYVSIQKHVKTKHTNLDLFFREEFTFFFITK